MRLTCLALLTGLSLIISIACNKSGPSPSTNAPRETVAAPTLPNNQNQTAPPKLAGHETAKVDACGLLTSSDIQSVQGEAVIDSKLSSTSQRGVNVSQCFFTLPTFANSISLSLTTRGEGKEAQDPKAVWNDTFREEHRDSDNQKQDRTADEDEASAPHQKVPGLGQDAYWIGSRVGGALYVLKGNSFIRISVGGAGDQAAKVRKSQMLAQKILPKI